MSFGISKVTVGTPVVTNGTVTFPYPTGTTGGQFAAFGHKLWVDKFQRMLVAPADFTVSFGASNITVTYKGATTIPANAQMNAQFNIEGRDANSLRSFNNSTNKRISARNVLEALLGSPVAGVTNGFVASQNLTSAGVFSVDVTAAGALAAASLKGVTDVPRNVVAAWTGAAVLTVTGLDEYNKVVKESSASGTSFAGKKAFAKVTNIEVSANVTGLTVGTGNVLGLPVFLPAVADVLKEIQDGAVATAGTIVAGVTTPATATTGDVRGTYTPNATPDGVKAFKLIFATGEDRYAGVSQYAG